MRAKFIWLATVLAPVLAAGLPLGERAGRELTHDLERFYAGRPVPRDAFDRVEGRAAASIALRFVVTHMNDVGRTAREKNLFLLAWAMQLLRFDTSPDEMPLVKTLIQRRLFVLMDRYRDVPRFADMVIALMDTTHAWTPRHLGLLARRAGTGSVEERLWHVDRMLSFAPWPAPEVRRMLRELRAIEPARRTDEQWGLIGLSGRATPRELVRILLAGAHAFAAADPASRVLDVDHPIRMTIDFLVERFDADEDEAVAVVERAEELSDREPDRGSFARAERDRFFEAVHNDIEISPPAPAKAAPGPVGRPRKSVKFRSKYRREGNLVYMFQKPCADGLTKGETR